MEQIIDFFKDLKTLIPLIVSVVAVSASAFTTLRNKSKRKRMSNDCLQELRNETAEIKEIVEKIAKQHEHEKFVNSLKIKIYDIVNSIIDNNQQELDRDFESMLIEGAGKAADMFGDIKEIGYQNIKSHVVKRIAIMNLKVIRSNYSLDNVVQQRIKSEVAYPLLNGMISDLEAFRKGVYNGTSDQKYTEIVLNFISKLMNQAIIIYKNEKNG